MSQKLLVDSPWIAAAAGLAAGYVIAGLWMGVPVILLWLFAVWFSRKAAPPQVPSLLLGAGVCLAGIGVLLRAPGLLMVFSTAAALAGWDLKLSQPASQGAIQAPPESRLRKKHLESLALALGLGLITAGLGSVARLQVPFGLMVLLVVLAFIALDWVAKGFKKPEKDG